MNRSTWFNIKKVLGKLHWALPVGVALAVASEPLTTAFADDGTLAPIVKTERKKSGARASIDLGPPQQSAPWTQPTLPPEATLGAPPTAQATVEAKVKPPKRGGASISVSGPKAGPAATTARLPVGPADAAAKPIGNGTSAGAPGDQPLIFLTPKEEPLSPSEIKEQAAHDLEVTRKVLERARERKAKASISLTPLEIPSQKARALAPVDNILKRRGPQLNPQRPMRSQHSLTSMVSQPQFHDDRFEIIAQSAELSVPVRRSRLLRSPGESIYRTAVVDPTICEVVQFTPSEVSIIGKSQGATNVTFWFEDDRQVVTYLVRVTPDQEAQKEIEEEYVLLENLLRDIFPDSKVYLRVVANKLIVQGQAKDSEEASQIMSILRTQVYSAQTINSQRFGTLNQGEPVAVLNQNATGNRQRPSLQIINMLRVPGVQQVALRVKIAELTRSAGRGAGIDVAAEINLKDSDGSALFINSLLSAATGTPSILSRFDADDIEIGVHYLEQHGVIRVLSEPTVVTLSGRAATFVAGGEFAVPTVVGSAGLNAVTTDFRAFGAIISFLPTVIDKDKIRLEVSPEFSQINNSLSVGGTPGLNVRAVSTTVEMREGQTLAIAGLLDESMTANSEGVLPILSWLIGKRDVSRNETELIILVTPELVHPLDAVEVPPLPGFDVTEPNNVEFYGLGKLEGVPTREYRSTVWPRLKHRYGAGGPAYTSGEFGHGN